MTVFIEIEQVDKVFTLADGGEYIALENIGLTIRKGEFVSLIGHSGCGKSTLLNIVAGLDMPTNGSVILAGQPVVEPGPDRMVVFQNYSLLPWLTVRENIALAVDEVYADKSKQERNAIVEEHIALVGLKAAADSRPEQLSGGMKQRVAIARALAIRPQLLLLDEPFGALDALTRGSLQEQLMAICEESRLTCLMVTHDVDEALLLSDRIVMLSNGPSSGIDQILEVPFARPRHRLEVVNDPGYYSLRSEMIYFLNKQKRIKQLRARAPVARHGLEKINLQIGFVPLTACAPLAIAQEKGFFARHGLEEVRLVREGNWRAISDGIAGGWFDAAQMPAGMPLWFSLGGANEKPLPVATALTTTRNGNAITLARRFLKEDIFSLESFADYLKRTPDLRHTLGVVHPSSMHNLLLRYWLAAGGIHPDRDVDLRTIPPAQMVANLRAGNIDGFCVGEPWNIRAAVEQIGFTVATDLEIWLGHPAKVLGVREDWLVAHPNTHLALIKALLEACRFCAEEANAEEVRAILRDPRYLDTDPAYVQLGDDDPTSCRIGDNYRPYAHHEFFGPGLNRPSRTEQLWILTQLARWGTVPFPRNWVEILERVCRVNAFSTAARELGLDVNYRRGPIELFDRLPFDADDPIGYLGRLTIKNEVYIADVAL
ncbi:nitrate ABC transporter ATP-binding protein [Gloeobacter kilaueensis]|uniref:Nitrate ABC transporter, ATPase subunits C and D n=1 Tax=Gloeobacter kilaueensis (strain ATCC BAA-2537 / CCAP 1431/1 / ULC 316 / JS1) TaxID=1183438 RepID=U5QNK8_GLOK1|nr:nitrate ABC transporter ATP-binding protein [Gloeobacter kilaueensis]AGY60458.1 nitrate ABC transporter, ATPase subunits C and D [Gloeobacter kilaueensis JS1]